MNNFMKKTICNLVKLSLLLVMVTSCYSCKDSYAQITYSLVCSETFLEYATPQVSYKNNDGNVVSINISDSEWTNATNKTVTINGIERPYKQWNFTVSYDDFGVVNDEMTITYIPKDNAADASSSISNLLGHDLSAQVEVRDKDDNMHYYSHNSIDLSISIGESATLVDKIKSYQDYLGFRIEDNGNIEVKKK